MENKIVLDIKPTAENVRNSEGCFFRNYNGDILYAYSRWSGSAHDDAMCDIALIRSNDEGETWSDYELIARARDFDVDNIMDTSFVKLKDGRLCVFFLIKEKDGSSTIGRTVSSDGISFCAERCICNMPKDYYVIENDRFIRLHDGRIATVASQSEFSKRTDKGYVVALVSDDDGAEFHCTETTLSLPYSNSKNIGLQEPAIIELSENLIWILARTAYGFQYQSFSFDGLRSFTPAEPSVFSSPLSPIAVKRMSDNSLVAAYNPIPVFDGRDMLLHDMRSPDNLWSGRTPLVLRRSVDNGRTWGELYPIETAKGADFCYPALFETRDGGILCAYWCVEEKNGDSFYCSMRITKTDKIIWKECGIK